MTIDRQINVHILANCDRARFGEPPAWGIINCFWGRVFLARKYKQNSYLEVIPRNKD
jgi:hypothetical protein